MKQASAVRATTSSSVPRASWLAVMSRKQSSSAPRRVIGDRRLDGIAGIAQVDEIDAFDDAAVLDVEAGDHAGLEHARVFARRGREFKGHRHSGRSEAEIRNR